MEASAYSGYTPPQMVKVKVKRLDCAVVEWPTWTSLKLCGKLDFPDYHTVCLKVVLRSVLFVSIVFD